MTGAGETPAEGARQNRGAAQLAAQAAFDTQGEDIVLMDVRTLSGVTDYVIICSAGSARQLHALKDHIEAVLEQHGHRVWHIEGMTASPSASAASWRRQPQWILMDCGEVVVHLLDQETRAFYRLEDLWADAPRMALSDIPSASQQRTGQREGV